MDNQILYLSDDDAVTWFHMHSRQHKLLF